MSEKGVSKHWTPRQELFWELAIRNSHTFAQRHILTLLRDLLKYDQRSREAKRRFAQARLRLITASDEDLKSLAELEALIGREAPGWTVAERLEQLEKERAMLRKKGVKKEELVGDS